MASNIETGHEVNNNNFKTLTEHCVSYQGMGKYTPSNVAIQIPQLQALWTSSNTAQTNLTTILAGTKTVINQRKLAFDPLDKLVTRCFSSLKSSNADKELIKDVKGMADKIRGHKVKQPTLQNGQNPGLDWVSNSHLSYVQKCASFRTFIDLLLTTSEYNPNEPELTTAALNTLHTSLKNMNDTFATSVIVPLELARNERNHIMYDHNTGLVDIALKVKEYVKSVFGASAIEARQVVKIKFTRAKKGTLVLNQN